LFIIIIIIDKKTAIRKIQNWHQKWE